MKLLNSITLGLLATTSLVFSDTTMCFKENHQSMSTIENAKLDGGVCNGTKSLNDMKNDGWIVDDIKISQSQNGMNFIYILKQPTINATSSSFTGNNQDMEARILAKLEKKKEDEVKAKKIDAQKELATGGESFYIKKCQVCHGQKGETEARGFSRPLNSLSIEEMTSAISGYTNGTYDRGMANIMQPITNTVTTKDLEKIHAYLKKINSK